MGVVDADVDVCHDVGVVDDVDAEHDVDDVDAGDDDVESENVEGHVDVERDVDVVDDVGAEHDVGDVMLVMMVKMFMAMLMLNKVLKMSGWPC